ncbi:hypothetical protein Hdeb2414_s0016g00497841 [Helianthus debilis subsp. tardiflorus]
MLRAIICHVDILCFNRIPTLGLGCMMAESIGEDKTHANARVAGTKHISVWQTEEVWMGLCLCLNL